jgi:hypothetical protein
MGYRLHKPDPGNDLVSRLVDRPDTVDGLAIGVTLFDAVIPVGESAARPALPTSKILKADMHHCRKFICCQANPSALRQGASVQCSQADLNRRRQDMPECDLSPARQEA